MKKIILFSLLFNFLILPAFAAESAKVSVQQVQLQAEMLKNNFGGYEITISNNSKDPLKISCINIKNITNNANQVLVSEALQGIKKNNKYIYSSILTFGVTGFVGSAKNNAVLSRQKAALSEAATFETQIALENMKSEILMPNRTKTFKVLTPISQSPVVECLLQNINTEKYVEVMN